MDKKIIGDILAAFELNKETPTSLLRESPDNFVFAVGEKDKKIPPTFSGVSWKTLRRPVKAHSSCFPERSASPEILVVSRRGVVHATGYCVYGRTIGRIQR